MTKLPEREPPTSHLLLTPQQQGELALLDGNPDTTDVPEASEANWRKAVHFYKTGE